MRAGDGNAPGPAGPAGRGERPGTGTSVARTALRCPQCGAALELDRRTLALAAFEPRPGQRFDERVSKLLDAIVDRQERGR
jgi:threonine synthase